MTVVQGNKALASDYNTLRTQVNRWFADNYAGSISFGNSNQTYGWGGSAVSSVSAGNLMTASQMNALINRCNIGEDICNSVSGQLSQIVTGNQMTATEFNAIESKSNSITSQRNNIEAAEMSIGGGGNSSRSTSYSSAINATFRYTFTDFDDARYFFNSGGALTFYGTITGYSTGTGYDGAGIDEIFTNMGTVTMDLDDCTYSGSGGVSSSIGYYDLTTSYQTIHTQAGVGVYSDATLQLSARRSSSGNYVELRVTITPESGRTVNGTTTCYTQRRILNSQSSGGVTLSITAPSYSLIDGL
jgi:hypothetical protein